MDINENSATATAAPASPAPASFDILVLLTEIKGRLEKVEADNAGMRGELEAARNRGEVDLNLSQIKHVMQKYFPHDLAELEVVPPPVAKFDAFTGAPLAN